MSKTDVGAAIGHMFGRFARASVRFTGHPAAFGLAVFVIFMWALTGPIFGFSDTWQLVINTATTIVTFLMVFLLQNAQNRDSEAIQLKLAELIRASEAAHNALLDVENVSESELEQIKARYGRLARKARNDLRSGKPDLGCPNAEEMETRTRENPNHEAARDHHHNPSNGTRNKITRKGQTYD